MSFNPNQYPYYSFNQGYGNMRPEDYIRYINQLKAMTFSNYMNYSPSDMMRSQAMRYP